jgi:hypothetical protein
LLLSLLNPLTVLCVWAMVVISAWGCSLQPPNSEVVSREEQCAGSKCSLKTEDSGSFYVNIPASGSVITHLSLPLAYGLSLLFQMFVDFIIVSNYTSVEFGQGSEGRLSQKGSQLAVSTV